MPAADVICYTIPYRLQTSSQRSGHCTVWRHTIHYQRVSATQLTCQAAGYRQCRQRAVSKNNHSSRTYTSRDPLSSPTWRWPKNNSGKMMGSLRGADDGDSCVCSDRIQSAETGGDRRCCCRRESEATRRAAGSDRHVSLTVTNGVSVQNAATNKWTTWPFDKRRVSGNDWKVSESHSVPLAAESVGGMGDRCGRVRLRAI